MCMLSTPVFTFCVIIYPDAPFSPSFMLILLDYKTPIVI
nr:MAG TPA: hypothetical protein [Caudoviricetes sp.]